MTNPIEFNRLKTFIDIPDQVRTGINMSNNEPQVNYIQVSLPTWLHEKIKKSIKPLQTKSGRIVELIQQGRNYESHLCDHKEHLVKYPANISKRPEEQIIKEIKAAQSVPKEQTNLFNDQLDSIEVTGQSEFEEFWKYYPIKAGKKKCLNVWNRDVGKKLDKIIRIWNSLYIYLKLTKERRNGGDIPAYKNADTWFKDWDGWIGYDDKLIHDVVTIKKNIKDLENKENYDFVP